ncbi:hypothetical protein ACFVZD_18420 [Streptomyces sp. NPDC058287]|uniref:hypothetical protein n=1 Tax=unclassified Streptomyces TaxID=2593676 RepID=UPI0036EE5D40
MPGLGIDAIREAAHRLSGRAVRTPLLNLLMLDGLLGGRVLVKGYESRCGQEVGDQSQPSEPDDEDVTGDHGKRRGEPDRKPRVGVHIRHGRRGDNGATVASTIRNRERPSRVYA